MFHSARIKLTAWYLIIVMMISVLFSITLYRFLDGELDRIERTQQRRFAEQFSPFAPGFFQGTVQPTFDPTVFTEARDRILITLILINFGILVLAGGAGYFLAARTLRPIQDMVNEQNRFITDASHELRTPLTALKSETEVYLRGNHHKIKEANNLLLSNLEEINNLQTLSDNLIQLAQYQKPTTNKVTLTKVSLSDVMQTAQKKLQQVAKQKSITVETNTKDHSLHGDRESLIQLFTILLDNAIKYSPENSSIKIDSTKADHSILIHVIDQGVGIEKKDIPHIFDRFYRADSSRTKQNIPGYGLGLSIAKKIVDSHHGTITVKSKPDEGATFTVQLPLAN